MQSTGQSSLSGRKPSDKPILSCTGFQKATRRIYLPPNKQSKGKSLLQSIITTLHKKPSLGGDPSLPQPQPAGGETQQSDALVRHVATTEGAPMNSKRGPGNIDI